MGHPLGSLVVGCNEGVPLGCGVGSEDGWVVGRDIGSPDG